MIKEIYFSSLRTIERNFGLSVSEEKYVKALEITRVLTGLMLMHRSIDIYGFSLMGNDPAYVASNSALAAFLAFCIACGFLTPLALLISLCPFFIAPDYASSLFHQIAIITCWTLIFAGAGKRYSLDAYFKNNFEILESFYSKIYFLAQEFTSLNIALIRFCALLMFNSISFCALMYHFYDDFWVNGTVLKLLFTTSYLTDYSQAIAAFRDSSPTFFDFLCRVSLYIQGIWEIVLIPFMFFRWGRVFACFQGIGFFTLCLFCMNLGYLSLLELILWYFLFACSGDFKAIEVEQNTKRKPGLPLNIYYISSIIMITFFTVFHTSTIISRGDSYYKFAQNKFNYYLMRVWAQTPVNVFNLDDLKMGEANFTIYEINNQGKRIRKVPFLDVDGSRMDYLKNDLMYFDNSLNWQRLPMKYRFLNEDYSKLGPVTQSLMLRTAILDSCVLGKTNNRMYQVDFYTREILDPDNAKVRWSDSKLVNSVKFKLPSQYFKRFESSCKKSFDLPPGH